MPINFKDSSGKVVKTIMQLGPITNADLASAASEFFIKKPKPYDPKKSLEFDIAGYLGIGPELVVPIQAAAAQGSKAFYDFAKMLEQAGVSDNLKKYLNFVSGQIVAKEPELAQQVFKHGYIGLDTPPQHPACKSVLAPSAIKTFDTPDELVNHVYVAYKAVANPIFNGVGNELKLLNVWGELLGLPKIKTGGTSRYDVYQAVLNENVSELFAKTIFMVGSQEWLTPFDKFQKYGNPITNSLLGKVKKKIVTSQFEKEEHDWFIEDKWVSERLFAVEKFEGSTGSFSIIDPFCGTGRIMDAAKNAGAEIVSGYDLVDRGAGKNHPGFFIVGDGVTPTNQHGDATGSFFQVSTACIVTNPPYERVNELFEQMIKHGVNAKVAMFLPLMYLAGKAKYLAKLPFAKLYILKPRPNCLPGSVMEQGVIPKGGKKDYAWFVFHQNQWSHLSDYFGPSDTAKIPQICFLNKRKAKT